jgi:mannose/fructose-specific phosphotransferase system component IIA
MTRSDAGRHSIYGVLIGHGDLPRALFRAATDIVGESEDFSVISNQDVAAPELESRLDHVLAEHGDREVLVFVDMFGSSCANVSTRARRRNPNVAVVCGVNLAMVVRFMYYRDRMSLAEIVELMRKTGQDEMRPVPR